MEPNWKLSFEITVSKFTTYGSVANLMKISQDVGSVRLFAISENLIPDYVMRLTTEGFINSRVEAHVIHPVLGRSYFIEVQQTYSEVHGIRTYTTNWKIDGHQVLEKNAVKDVEHIADLTLLCSASPKSNGEINVTNFNFQVFPTGKIEDI